jgi:hypothetical protein
VSLLDRVKATLAEAGERQRREELEKALEELRLFKTPTPVVPTNHVVSIDSIPSTTGVESLDDKLKAVAEVVQEVQEPHADQENNPSESSPSFFPPYNLAALVADLEQDVNMFGSRSSLLSVTC